MDQDNVPGAEPRLSGDDATPQTTGSNGKVSLAELIDHGLNRQPAFIAGVWLPSVRALVCRSHVSQPIMQRLGVEVDQPTGEALLMTGGRTTERALRIWCPACRGDVEGNELAAVVTLYPIDDLEVRS